MKRHNRVRRAFRWVTLVAVSGFLPGFIMSCDKAALNFQRGFFEGLGIALSAQLVDSGIVPGQGA